MHQAELKMAARSIFLTLTRGEKKKTLLRFLSSTASGSELVSFEESAPNSGEDEQSNSDDLKSRIFRLRLPKRSATNVLQRWVGEGRQISASDLRQISKDLRKSHRFKHALELSEWMVSHEEFKLSDTDYAVRIELMAKVFGIDAAERYFEGLPPNVKTSETYTALLHCYAASKLTAKAEELYARIKESNLPLTALTYNELMTLYMSVGEVEKVSSVVEELKCQKVAPDLFTYNLWISSCASALQIDEVRRILAEMSSAAGNNEGWSRYVNLANIYLTSGHLVNSEINCVVESEKGVTQREWITYDFLIILYGGMGNKDKLDQIWKSLRMTKQKMISRNYVCIVCAYLMLGHLKEVGEVIDQQSATTDFDVSVCNRLSKAFEEAGLVGIAETFRTILTEKDVDIAMN